MSKSAQGFVIPAHIPLSHQVDYCLEILQKQRTELLMLRSRDQACEHNHKQLEEEIKEWEEKYKNIKDEIKQVEKENTILRREIEKLTKTNMRYQIALFDHGNFKHKHEGDTDKKRKGGQKGHTDTNRERHTDYSSFKKKRIFTKTCGKCQSILPRVSSTKQKILLDIVINPQIQKMIIQSERQWCSKCKREVVAKDPQSLPFTEYGINTFMMTMILRFSCHSSMNNISKILSVGYGLSISKSDVANLLQTSAKYLGKHYEELKKAVRSGKVMYADETGWMIHGQKAWMWIMTNEKETVYIAAESRGGGIAKDIYGNSNAYAMTDGLASYFNAIAKDKHLYCWAHVLRFAFEETVKLKPEHLACKIRDRLVDLYQTIRSNQNWTGKEKETFLKKELESILSMESTDQTVTNILHRVRVQKEGLILSLLMTEDGTNNLAERELRNMSIKRTVSNGSDTHKGMETTAIIGSVLQTLQRNKETQFFPTLKTYLQMGIQEKYQQYIHTAYYDS